MPDNNLSLSSHTSSVDVRRLPPGTTVTLEEHPDKPTFTMSDAPLDEFLAIELTAAMNSREASSLIEQNALVMELLRQAFGAEEWARFRQAMKEIPVETVLRDPDGEIVRDDHGNPVTTLVNKAFLIRDLYQGLFTLYASRPTLRPAT